MRKIVLKLLCLSFLIAGCSAKEAPNADNYPASYAYSKEEAMYSDSPSTEVLENNVSIIDYSNRNNGYITIKLKENIDKKIKLQVIHTETYTYDIASLDYVGIPLQMGDGLYTLRVLKNINSNQYDIVDSVDIEVNIEDELQSYLYPNQIINYNENSLVVDKSFEVCTGLENNVQRIEACYQWVIDELEYDNDKVQVATQKYIVPDLDEIMKTKKGICFDYAALLCAMLRLQHIPTRVICGNTDIEYHAWIEVYLEGEGWVNPDLYVDEDLWSRLDPTFADSKYDYEGSYDAIYYY